MTCPTRTSKHRHYDNHSWPRAGMWLAEKTHQDQWQVYWWFGSSGVWLGWKEVDVPWSGVWTFGAGSWEVLQPTSFGLWWTTSFANKSGYHLEDAPWPNSRGGTYLQHHEGTSCWSDWCYYPWKKFPNLLNGRMLASMLSNQHATRSRMNWTAWLHLPKVPSWRWLTMSVLVVRMWL